jgi:predicted transport protein
MPLFQIANDGLKPISQSSFKSEKQLQHLIETNLVAVFNSRFVASEFRTGALHAGRIDTLALSEDNNPVIIEYKTIESSDLITQSLFYLHWLADHRGDFEVAARKKLGSSIEVDWSDIRVICIAPNYKRYDLHAVQMMGANIELWRYRLFANTTLYLEEVYRQALRTSSETVESEKNPVMVAAGKKARITAETGRYTLEQHFTGKSEKITALAYAIREFVLSLDPAIQETPKKYYIAYKVSQNIVCMVVRKQHVVAYVKLDPKAVSKPPQNSRDMSEIDHPGTGDFELVLESKEDATAAFPFIEAAYRAVGG